MKLKNNTYSLRNAYLLGLATATTILTINFTNPPALADSQVLPANSLISKSDKVETVPVKRVIFFNLLSGVQKVEQVSYAHRQVSNDPKQPSVWIVEPFEEIKIPEQAGFVPSISPLPTITRTNDLSCFKHPIDVFYHPLDADSQLDKPAKQEKQNEDCFTQTSIATEDWQTNTESYQVKSEGVQSDSTGLADKSTNTMVVKTKDEAIQEGHQGIDTGTDPLEIGHKDQGTQVTSEVEEQGVGESIIDIKDTAAGDSDYRYQDQNWQTDALPQDDKSTMTDFNHPKLISTGTGDALVRANEQATQTNDYSDEKPKQDTRSTQTTVEKKEAGTQTMIPTVENSESQTNYIETGETATQTKTEAVDEEVQTENGLLQDQEIDKSRENYLEQESQTDRVLQEIRGTQSSIPAQDNNQQTDNLSQDAAIQVDPIETKEEGTDPLISYQERATQTELKQTGKITPPEDNQNKEISFRSRPQSTIQEINEESAGITLLDDNKHGNFHQRIRKANDKLKALKHKNNKRQQDKGMLPQTGNKTDSLATFIGLGITLLIAGMSLFSLKKIKSRK
ncbi:LPXTG cell wall anchor domain-containing protein [Limosilactobacillus sp. RRLNB_1_1]|uniref:LPXTG cell wall anchor domain-containing protein n=1 Tax=Limosilactobacillus albertensis TaxID=2759752 RepID=A0A7W3TRL4_9LACO|nr:LPXTG cell wall anchor domain-containing protein [Limosilactobacillus albertensis]MBB1069622.1 LPXTG cell wall anchor domain-containing protein [Limosilactobacillus albertensis]MCD7118179.1 LPXTG cell wall anchor domain-containing protein [Limosilactobacillus albertensis]MCD7127993.1 LPXTG cell wall anchor domain-containing protein [Limosilactobacillus albertensis]